eukprot:TRINITY_DN40636_c0_g1_i1.p1 TRINITY_DN40636_c0_g1~~TRINITY_DN40636_c0_g1_i1.p1  ORF type:complete len:118 (+),score=21.58 TRINITY_DN40636_c0_g1_i1:103-456(+)
MIRRPPRSTLSSSSAASDVYKRQVSTQSTGTLCVITLRCVDGSTQIWQRGDDGSKKNVWKLNGGEDALSMWSSPTPQTSLFPSRDFSASMRSFFTRAVEAEDDRLEYLEHAHTRKIS